MSQQRKVVTFMKTAHVKKGEKVPNEITSKMSNPNR